MAPGLGQIRADSGNIEQVIMNLVINASDAMQDGGTLTINTENVRIDEVNRIEHHPEIQSGFYVLFSVGDTGCGMEDEIREHMFEPFFTTKEVGKGTGLGLATVYSIVKQSNAYINVQSEIGKGSEFRIYFPRVESEGGADKQQNKTTVMAHGTETILLVDDDYIVRGMLRSFLQSIGYAVIPAHNGAEAIELAKNHEKDIHVLLTDVVMPGINGFELANNMKKSRPEIKVFFMSGYAKPDNIHKMMSANDNFIEKPICIYTLSVMLRKVLGDGG